MSDNLILVSNHLLQYPEIKFPAEAVIRINLAWVGSAFALEGILETIKYDVFLDFPEARKKPPTVALTYSVLLKIAADYKRVKYIAVSNIESDTAAYLFAKSMPEGIQFVPKIETKKGVDNLQCILDETRPKYMMLDTEDLFLDVDGDVGKYEELINKTEQWCLSMGVIILKIQGVVFAPYEK